MPPPLAFLSYTRKDDEFFGGYITAFRKMLENAVHVTSGQQTFRVFQDIEGIVIGENWQKKLSQVLHESSVMVPMVTPLFFNSQPCRAEVEDFLEHERSLHRGDMIWPVYFLSSAKLEKKEERDRDPIVREIASRQMFDWRQNAHIPLDQPAAREAILKLAAEIGEATERITATNPQVRPGASSVAALAADPRLGRGVDSHLRRESLGTQNLLWVDDRPENNSWERRALQSYGMHFALARNTDEAKQLLSEPRAFAAIISDMGRPGDQSAGFTLLKWVRENPLRDQPYFIYTSAHGARRQPAAGDPAPQGMTCDPDTLVKMVVAALR
jgi:CheY-like chemotaxis protein